MRATADGARWTAVPVSGSTGSFSGSPSVAVLSTRVVTNGTFDLSQSPARRPRSLIPSHRPHFIPGQWSCLTFSARFCALA